MKVLLVGAGGREHALAWRLRRDVPNVEIVAAPGNPGISELAKCVPVSGTDVDRLLELARSESVDWTLVGPEAPLAAGAADAFRARGLPTHSRGGHARDLEGVFENAHGRGGRADRARRRMFDRR